MTGLCQTPGCGHGQIRHTARFYADYTQTVTRCIDCGCNTFRPILESEPNISFVALALRVPDEEKMYDFLNALNVSGLHPEVAGASDDGAGAFVATLTEPDADYVNYIYADGNGESRCVANCEECTNLADRGDWSPKYPITVVVSKFPNLRNCADNEIETWWVVA